MAGSQFCVDSVYLRNEGSVLPKTGCIKADGSPKHAYPTRDAAVAEAARHKGAQKPYACKEHGWHLGGVLSRALRRSIQSARKKRRAA